MIGGMETMAVNLANHFTRRGLEVHVATPVAADTPDEYDFRVHRCLSRGALTKLAGEADLVLSNGVGLYVTPHALLSGTPLILRHSNYQVSAVEATGFIYGRPAPMTPWKSIWFHLSRPRSLRRVLRDGPKMLVVRFIAQHLTAANVAISDWMVYRQPLAKQVRIHNPFPITRFERARAVGWEDANYDVVFLGRLSDEKGVDTLIEAIGLLREAGLHLSLRVIGGGAYRSALERLAERLGVGGQVTFTGPLKGAALVDAVADAKIAAVPSIWEEAFGGVTTELLNAGKPLVVSERGAPAEIVGDAGLTFPNGDAQALAAALETIYTSPETRARLANANGSQVARFDEERLIDQYLRLFASVLAGAAPASITA